MRHPWSLLRYAIMALVIASGLFAAPAPAYAVPNHFRYGHVTWRATGGTSVQFQVTAAFRRSPEGTPTAANTFAGSAADGFLDVGDTFVEFIGRTRLATGVGFQTIGGFQGLRFIVVSVDLDNDLVIGRALDPITGKDRLDYTYPTANNGGAPWRASISSQSQLVARDLRLNNNSDLTFRVSTDIDLSVNSASPVGAIPPIVPGPPTGYSFLIPVTDPEQHRLVYRLADADEPIAQPATGFQDFTQPPGVTVDPNTGVFTVPPGLGAGLWSTHVIVEEYDAAGLLIGQVGLDFNLRIRPASTSNPPRFVVPPTPADGTVISAVPGQRINFNVQAFDPDFVSQMVVNSTGLPSGARMQPTLPFTTGISSFANLAFSWTPLQEDVGSHTFIFTASDIGGDFAMTSISVRVAQSPTLIEPNGGEAYFPGQSVLIQWDNHGFPRSQGVRIELSRDSGRTFSTVIVDNTPDTESYLWIATLPLNKSSRIRVTNVADPNDFGVSAGDFVIIDGDDPERCTAGPSIDIPDNSTTWTESPLSFPNNLIIRGLRVKVNATHPFTGDLHIELVHPDGTIAILHRQTGEGSDDLDVTYGAGAIYTAPDESLVKFYGKFSQGTWKLRVRDLIPGDVGKLNFWCLQVIGLKPGTIRVVSPNGGETLAVGTKYTATWSEANISGTTVVQLSRDGGATYTNIGQVAAGIQSFQFTATAPVTTQARLRVAQSDEPVLSDVSDGDFSIALPFLRIDAPLPGDRVSVGQPTEIKWSGTPTANSVRIEFSKDSGLNWTPIAGSAPDTGTFVWTPTPDDDTTGARIRITANTGPVRFDASDADFIVQTPAVIVNSPNGGETWHTLTTRPITWQTVGVTGPMRIELSRDRGQSWETLFPSTPDDGSENWPVGGMPTADALVRITSVEEETLFDVSDAPFRIVRMNIQLTAPNGGQQWGTGSTQDITWTTDGVTGNIDLLVSRDGGQTFGSIAADIPNNGLYRWTVTGPGSSQAIVKAKARDFAVEDTSNGVFSIIGAAITVNNPNGGEVLRVGQDYPLAWSSQGLGGNVRIELSRDGGSSWETLFANTPNDGTETWRVAGSDTTNARLRVTSTDSMTLVLDTSDAPFSVLNPRLTVTEPNGGDTWIVETVQTIRWDHQAVPGNIRIEVTRNGGLSWQTIVDSTENDGVADWTVTAPGGSNCRVRVSSVDNAAVRDESDGPFSIIQPALRLSSPNGGQNWLLGTTQSITWSSSGLDTAEQVAIDISRDSGASWERLFVTDNDGSQPWTVEGVTTATARIRVTVLGNNTITDSSDSSFRISVPDIRITGPARKVIWKNKTRQTITWTGTSVGNGTVDIQLSRNNGRTWETIIDDTTNDGSANWTVALPAAARARLRIIWNPVPTVQNTTSFFIVIRR